MLTNVRIFLWIFYKSILERKRGREYMQGKTQYLTALPKFMYKIYGGK